MIEPKICCVNCFDWFIPSKDTSKTSPLCEKCMEPIIEIENDIKKMGKNLNKKNKKGDE